MPSTKENTNTIVMRNRKEERVKSSNLPGSMRIEVRKHIIRFLSQTIYWTWMLKKKDPTHPSSIATPRTQVPLQPFSSHIGRAKQGEESTFGTCCNETETIELTPNGPIESTPTFLGKNAGWIPFLKSINKLITITPRLTGWTTAISWFSVSLNIITGKGDLRMWILMIQVLHITSTIWGNLDISYKCVDSPRTLT
mgnify:CR=1 FL=1